MSHPHGMGEATSHSPIPRMQMMHRADMGELIARAGMMGASYMVPLLRLVQRKRLTLYAVPRGCRRSILPFPGRSKRPILAVIADDNHVSSGPIGFPAAASVLRWARAVVFHSAQGDASHYAAAGELAMQVRAAVLVETSSAHLAAWQALASDQCDPPGLPLGFTVMAEGGPHPQLPAVLQ